MNYYKKYKEKYINLNNIIQTGGRDLNLLYIGTHNSIDNPLIEPLKLGIDEDDIINSIKCKNCKIFKDTVYDGKFNMIFVFIRENEKEIIKDIVDKLIISIIDGGKIYFFNIDETNITPFPTDTQITVVVINNEQTNIFNVIHRHIDSDIIYEVNDNCYHIKCGTSDKLDSIIQIDDDNIELYILSKCDTINTGTHILTQIKLIAKELKKKTVKLYDDSAIYIQDCYYSLSHYYILLKGVSWYNLHGFISQNHEDNVIYNKTIRYKTHLN